MKFIESSQLCSFEHSFWCNTVAFYPIESKGWQLGIWGAIHVLDSRSQIKLFEWIGPINNPGTLDFVHEKIISEWSKISCHFEYQIFSANAIQLLFLNQIRGTAIGNFSISKTCKSEIDHGIQCSIEGPDVFSPSVPFPVCKPSELEVNFDSSKLQNDEVLFSKAYYKNLNKKGDGKLLTTGLGWMLPNQSRIEILMPSILLTPTKWDLFCCLKQRLFSI